LTLITRPLIFDDESQRRPRRGRGKEVTTPMAAKKKAKKATKKKAAKK
jgi:hypothetical protein